MLKVLSRQLVPGGFSTKTTLGREDEVLKEFDIPDGGSVRVETLLTDFTGTLSENGVPIPGVNVYLKQLVDAGIRVIIITSDTYGTAKEALEGTGVEFHILDGSVSNHSDVKLQYLTEELTPETTVVMGNGLNDYGMLSCEKAALRIAICLSEGVAIRSMCAANLLYFSPIHALKALSEDGCKSIIATLRGRPKSMQ